LVTYINFDMLLTGYRLMALHADAAPVKFGRAETGSRPKGLDKMKATSILVSFIATCCCAAAADEPVTYVHGRDVRWNGVCVQVPSRFQQIGSFDFTLSHSAGRRTIFAEKSGATVTSMVAVQAEHMTDQTDRYRYPLQPGIAVASVALKVNALAASATLSARRSPQGETALTMQFLGSHGLEAPDEWLVVRYATYDAPGENEFLVFYMEPLDTNTLDLAAVGPSDLLEFPKAFDHVRQQAASILTFSPCKAQHA
jgi:hypothetical protein